MQSPEYPFQPPELLEPDTCSGGITDGSIEPIRPGQNLSPNLGSAQIVDDLNILVSENSEETFGDYLSKDAFWVLDYLQGIGYTRHLRDLAQREGIDFDAGLDELRRQDLLDESDPERPAIKWPKP